MTLPFLRFSRDKRGYENTFVVHSDRWRGRPRTRVLYWFRTPPGVKVGRSALDEAAVRLIEATHPDVEFDWPRILKGQGGGEPAPPTRSMDSEPRMARPIPESRPPRATPPGRPGGPRQLPADPALSSAPLERTEAIAASDAPDLTETLLEVQPAVARAEPAPDVSSGDGSPAHARLGAEGWRRLTARHADLRARILERVSDPLVQARLNDEAERLNPGKWDTDDEVTRGLERYETVLESIRAVVGQGRRRRGRESRPEVAQVTTDEAAPAAGRDDEREETRSVQGGAGESSQESDRSEPL